MITKKVIEKKVDLLKEKTGLNLFVEYAPCYGGYRLVIIGNNNNHTSAFGLSACCERVPAKVFNLYLDGLIGMYDFMINNKK